MIALDTFPTSAQDRVVLMSIKPCYWARILDGSKRFELRRRLPRLTSGALIVVYASAPEKALVGYFHVRRVVSAPPRTLWRMHRGALGIDEHAYFDYFDGAKLAWAIEVKSPAQLAPIALDRMREELPGFHPPQSFMYWPTARVRALAPDVEIESRNRRSPSSTSAQMWLPKVASSV